MKRLLPTLFITLLLAGISYAQTTYDEYRINGVRQGTFEPREAKPDFMVELRSMEAPTPDGDDYKAFLMRQKIESAKRFPRKAAEKSIEKKKTTAQPSVGTGMKIQRTLFNGNVLDFVGGIPNDNTLAISNGGIILAGVNSIIWAYDLQTDTTLFDGQILSLAKVASIGGLSPHVYDPKLIYDEKADRFILVFLKDNNAATSEIIVCFSQTNNPADPWNVYRLPGNPLNNNRWTDFPAINITDEELFITGNLIIPGVSWQVGFDGSVIWQVDKQAGYHNDSILPSKLYAQIKYDGQFTRNVHPVRGIGSSTSEQYFLSNRNFAVTNDTIFVMKIEGTLKDSASLKVTMGRTSPNYGVPPNGRQEDTDLNDPTKGLQTNDARVLGAITNGEWIQFVSTTVNPATGFAAIYHGMITNPTEEGQIINGSIFGDDSLDLAYPNIAFTGNEFCDMEAIVGLDFASPANPPGVGAFYFGNDSSYSNLLRIKNGISYTDRHSDSYERWGDYFGIQPKFNEPGTVWTAGFLGLAANRNGTWINELTSPDSSKITVSTVESGALTFCDGNLEILPSGGVPPYSYSFNGDSLTDNPILKGICSNDTVYYTVTDSRGCQMTDTLITKNTVADNGTGTYPNPFTDRVITVFELPSDQTVSAYIYDLKGAMVAKLVEKKATKGQNELSFNLEPLRAGMYVLKVIANDEEILSQKLVKSE